MGRYYSPAATVAAYGSLGAASMAAAAAVAAQHNAMSAHAAQHNQVSSFLKITLGTIKYFYFSNASKVLNQKPFIYQELKTHFIRSDLYNFMHLFSFINYCFSLLLVL